MKHYYYGGPNDGDKAPIDRCDLILRLPGITKSVGISILPMEEKLPIEHWEHQVLSTGTHVYVDPKLNIKPLRG